MSRRVPRGPTPRLGGQELPLGHALLEEVHERERQAYLRLRAELAPLPPVEERSKLIEGHWQKQIVAVAKRLGYYVYHPKLSRWSERGWPDLSLLGKRALWIECKTDDGLLTEKQVEVIVLMRRAGLEVHVQRPWHTLEHVAAILQAPGPHDCFAMLCGDYRERPPHPDDERMRAEARDDEVY